LASEFATLGILGSTVGGADAFVGSAGGGGGALAHALNAIAANAANDQARNPADRFLVVFNFYRLSSSQHGSLSADARAFSDRDHFK
jgi:hypothetical protein